MKTQFILFIIVCQISFMSCEKQDEFLDERLNKGDVVPTTLEDFQAILDNNNIMSINYSSLGPIEADNYYLIPSDYNTRSPFEKNAYTWEKVIFPATTSADWSNTYKRVMYCNVALDGISNIKQDLQNQSSYNNIKGSALFFRALSFYEMVQAFALPYAPQNLEKSGIILRTSSDLNIKYQRATIKECYDRIIEDLMSCLDLLPASPLNKFRPGKPAVEALLARIYVAIGDYDKALVYANMTLTRHNTLINFSTLSKTTTQAFPNFLKNHEEVFFYAIGTSFNIIRANGIARIDSNLYKSYVTNDLRKVILYKADNANPPKVLFKGSYTGTNNLFSGLATNELYLIKAEALARTGKYQEGMDVLNTLLKTRWVTNTFSNLTAGSQDDAIKIILQERRKELPFTAQLRWEDLRRLNLEPGYAQTIARSISGTLYSLPPNDPRYANPIPQEEIDLGGVEQNPR